MSGELRSTVERVSRVELELRLWKWGGLLVVGLMLMVVTERGGGAVGDSGTTVLAPFTVVAKDGRKLVQINERGSGALVSVLNAEGKMPATILADAEGAKLLFGSGTGSLMIKMEASEDGSGLILSAPIDTSKQVGHLRIPLKILASLTASKKGGALALKEPQNDHSLLLPKPVR